MPIVTYALSALVMWAVALALRRRFSHSPLDNIPGPPSDSFLKGNFTRLFDRHGWAFMDDLEEKYGSVVRLMGPLGNRILFVFDPKALQHIVVKDQYTYDQANFTAGIIRALIGDVLVSASGEQHKQQRKMLNPAFSVTHLKRMTPIFYRVVDTLRNAMKKKVEEGAEEMDVLDWMHRCSLELVGQGGLGYSFDPLIEERPNEYGAALKEFIPSVFALALVRFIFTGCQPLLRYIPASLSRWVVDRIPSRRIQRVKNCSEVIARNASSVLQMKKDAFQSGEEAVVKQVGEGKDILSILLRANMEAPEHERIPDEELLSQMSFLVLAATDTTSSSMTQIVQLLAQHPDVQERLREEIVQAQEEYENEIPYDRLSSLPYLDAVCRETLRLYPPFSFIPRDTLKDIVMPLSQPIRGADGNYIQEIPVPRGTNVIVGVRASNRNTGLWGEDAKEWKPERWLSPLPKSLEDAHLPGVYSNQMTFLGGGRACIGFKFSQLETKVALNILLQSFRFSPSRKSDDVIWNVAAVRYPTVGRESLKAELPLRIEII